MQCTYQLRTDLTHADDGQDLAVYGVNVVDMSEHTIYSVSDIFFNRKKAEAFVDLCNSSDLRLIHFMDIVNDALVYGT